MISDAFCGPTGCVVGPFAGLAKVWAYMAQVDPEKATTPEALATEVMEVASAATFEHDISHHPAMGFLWSGVFTPGRSATLTPRPGGLWALQWTSGTGGPSRWLSLAWWIGTPKGRRIPMLREVHRVPPHMEAAIVAAFAEVA